MIAQAIPPSVPRADPAINSTVAPAVAPPIAEAAPATVLTVALLRVRCGVPVRIENRSSDTLTRPV